jgi:hypothetical protein
MAVGRVVLEVSALPSRTFSVWSDGLTASTAQKCGIWLAPSSCVPYL